MKGELKMAYSVIPVVYVKNNTDEEIKNIYVTMDGYIKKDPVIELIKPGQQKVITILHTWYSGEKELKMYVLDKDNNRKEYILRDKIKGNSIAPEIKVRIEGVKENNEFTLVIDEELDNLYSGGFF